MPVSAQLAPQPGGIFFLLDGVSDEDDISGLPALGSAGHTLSRGLRVSGLCDPSAVAPSFLRSYTGEVRRLAWERRAHSVSVVVDQGLGRTGVSAWCADARAHEECLTAGTLPTELSGLPRLGSAGYATDPRWPAQFRRVRSELLAAQPNIAVPCGDTALWLLTGQASTDEWRGAPRLVGEDAPILRGASPAKAAWLRQLKLLPTYPPARINQQYGLMTAFCADLAKVRGEAAFPELRPLAVEIWLEPALADLEAFERRHIAGADMLTLDIETAVSQIVCVQVGTSPTTALVLPFVDYRKSDRSYWPSAAEELAAWEWLQRVLDMPQPKLGQNFSAYDLFWLFDRAGLTVRNYRHDLRLAQHILNPEMKKSLAFIGKMFTNMPSWKAAVHHHEDKREA